MQELRDEDNGGGAEEETKEAGKVELKLVQNLWKKQVGEEHERKQKKGCWRPYTIQHIITEQLTLRGMGRRQCHHPMTTTTLPRQGRSMSIRRRRSGPPLRRLTTAPHTHTRWHDSRVSRVEGLTLKVREYHTQRVSRAEVLVHREYH